MSIVVYAVIDIERLHSLPQFFDVLKMAYNAASIY